MNQITTTTAQAVALPSTAVEMMSLARELAQATLVPREYQKQPANIMLVMMFCKQQGLDFFSTIQHLAVIHGRLMADGQLAGALVNSSPRLADRLMYTFSGEGDGRTITVSGRLVGENEPREVVLTVKNVRTENDAWKKQPDQQLVYSGNRVWARRHLPEALLGILTEGEVLDVTPNVVRVAPTLPPHDPQTGEITDPPPGIKEERKPEMAKPEPLSGAKPVTIVMKEGEDWRTWGNKLIAYIRACTDLDMIERWIDANTSPLDLMMQAEPKLYVTLERAIDAHKATLPKREPTQ